MLSLEFAIQNLHRIYWYSSKISFWWTLIKIKQLLLSENSIPKFDFVNVIWIVFEIAEITVKMVCKMTFDDNYKFWWILKSYFLRKKQKSLFSTGLYFHVKRKRVLKKEMIILIKSRVAIETLPPKGDGEQTSEYNTDCILF